MFTRNGLIRVSQVIVIAAAASLWIRCASRTPLTARTSAESDQNSPACATNPSAFRVRATQGDDGVWYYTSKCFLYGCNIDDFKQSNFAPKEWCKRQIHGSLTDARQYYVNPPAGVKDENDLHPLHGIEPAHMVFYSGHGVFNGWHAMGGKKKKAWLRKLIAGDAGLLYLWQCSCNTAAHGPPSSLNDPYPDFNHPEFYKQPEGRCTEDPFVMRNVFRRWKDSLGTSLRMACSGSTELCYGGYSVTDSVWDLYNNHELKTADSFLLGLTDKNTVPLCISRGNDLLDEIPLFEDRVSQEPNPAGTGHYLYIKYTEVAEWRKARNSYKLKEILDQDLQLPVIDLLSTRVGEELLDFTEASSSRPYIYESTERTGDGRPRFWIHEASKAVYLRNFTEKPHLFSGEPHQIDLDLDSLLHMIDLFDVYKTLGREIDPEFTWIKIHVDRSPAKLPGCAVEKDVAEVLAKAYRQIALDDERFEAGSLKNAGIDFVPVYGPGGNLSLLLSRNGEPMNASVVWRQVDPAGSHTPRRVIRYSDAVNSAYRALETQFGVRSSDYDLTDDWRWGYKEEAGNCRQRRMYLRYWFLFEPRERLEPDAAPIRVEVPGHAGEYPENPCPTLDEEGSEWP